MVELQAKLEGFGATIQLVPPHWRIHHPKLDSVLPRKTKRKENATMRITATAKRVLKEVGALIADVQRMCAMKNIAPVRIAIKVDLKREKDALWCAAALRAFLVQNRFDVLAHIEVGKLNAGWS